MPKAVFAGRSLPGGITVRWISALVVLASACGTSSNNNQGAPPSGSGSGTSSSASSNGSGGSGSSSGGQTSGGSTSGSSSGSTGGGSSGSSSSASGASSDAGPPPAPGACTTLPTTPVPAGSIVQFNDNGAWSWYQDERAIVDKAARKLIIGSVAYAPGTARDANIEAVVYDLATKKGTRTNLGKLTDDDHDAPAFAIRPDGQYVAVWSTHRTDCNTYYSIYNGTSWAAQKIFDWTPLGCPWDGTAGATTEDAITYSNVWYMGTALYDVARSVNTSPNLLSSADNGQTWSYYGRLTKPPSKIGYVAGYYKYWGNNTDRIDFVGTEAHPRDFDNSLYHGYISGGQVFDSTGNVIDSSLSGPAPGTGTAMPMTNAVDVNQYTPVFKTGTTINGVMLTHAWNQDMVRYADGTIAVILQGRVAGSWPANAAAGTYDPDKRIIYARFDPTQKTWSLTYLVKAGPKLYSSEEDYTGLGTVDPDNPNVIYVSSTFDPRNDTTTFPVHEIFQGVTSDNGATFTWTPVTMGSTVDNLRPIIPKWGDADHKALLWLKGTYTTAQSYTLAVVGTLCGQ
jgi:hypothetical protein